MHHILNEEFMLSFKRYIAQTRLTEIGEEGQKRLSEAKVLIVGCGALGSPVAMYLAGAGVGNLLVADFDTVDISNLHRQVFYCEHDVGKCKSSILSSNIRALNSEVKVKEFKGLVTPTYLETIKNEIDIIADCADNPATTYSLQTFCKTNDIPLVIAGVTGWNVQIFSYFPGSTSFDEIFPQPDENSGMLPCSITGITGPTAALGASVQASEIIKRITGHAAAESFLFIADLLRLQFDVVKTS